MANASSGGVPRGVPVQPTSQQDYYKSLVPSQLVAERGEEIVVINPGSANVRIGLASAKAPVSVPHCIAHQLRMSGSEQDSAELPKKGAIGDSRFGTSSLSASRVDERQDALELVVSQLKVRSFFSDAKAGAGDSNSCELLSKERDTGFEWTNVEENFAGRSVPRIQKSSIANDRTDDFYKNHERNSGKVTTDADDAKDMELHKQKLDRFKLYRKYICGEEALKIPASLPYTLYRPMCRGRLNISSKYSMQQVCDDIYRIWDYILTEKCQIGSKLRPRFSAVLVVPDTLDNREVKELLSVVLRDLQFHSAVVIQECVAATFGNGFSSGCIVNMGSQVISGMCVEEGVAIPSTRFLLPYGGDDITRCLLWIQRRKKTWPIADTDLLRDPLDFQTLEKLKETHCVLFDGEQHTTVDVRCRMAGEPTRVYTILLSSLNIPPMGLFYPSLLSLEEFSPLSRPWFHIDHEDNTDDAFSEAGRRLETNETGLTNGSLNGNSINNDSDPYDFEDKEKKEVEEISSGLAQAIVKSILSLGRVDLQKKLFASIQLVGGVGLTKGLVDAVEERVLHAIPVDEAVDTVEVLPNRMDPMNITWKGGAVLAVLDFGRDSWVQYEDWLDGMVMVGSGRKYRDSNTLQAQAFWYNAMLD
uniref:ARP9 n=1 Tax=Sanionia uncinata TaxID=140003 RepID=A0A346PYC3_9BRYO|nr:ARP9 [Sanionia uncinata]